MGDTSFTYYIPLMFVFLTVFITGLFEFVEYYQKNLYSMFILGFLVLMYLMSFLLISTSVNEIIYCVELILITLLIIAMGTESFKRWKMKK